MGVLMNIFFRFIVCFTTFWVFTACTAPHSMTLKDGRVIETADEPEFNRKTGFYEYRTVDGKKVQINKDEVLEVKEK